MTAACARFALPHSRLGTAAMASAISLLHNPMEDEMSKLVAGAIAPDPAFAAVDRLVKAHKAHEAVWAAS
jgi:hypothetical protein